MVTIYSIGSLKKTDQTKKKVTKLFWLLPFSNVSYIFSVACQCVIIYGFNCFVLRLF